MEAHHDSIEQVHQRWVQEHQAAFTGEDDSVLTAIQDQHQAMMDKHQAMIDEHQAVIDKHSALLEGPDVNNFTEEELDAQFSTMRDEHQQMEREHDLMMQEHQTMQAEHQRMSDEAAAEKSSQ